MMKAIKSAAMGLVLAAVVAGGGLLASSSTAPPAGATPDTIIALNSANCVALGSAFGGLSTIDAASDCLNISKQTNMQHFLRCLRGADVSHTGTHACVPVADLPEPTQVLTKDLAPLDLDKNQVYAGQDLFIFAFVNDDSPVRFTSDIGHFVDSAGTLLPGNYFCQTGDPVTGGDPDCDGDPSTPGDGVVVVKLRIVKADGIGTGHVNAIQEQVGFPLTFTVTGPPVTLVVAPLFGKDTIQTGATAPPTSAAVAPLVTDCTFQASASAVLGANSQAEKAVLVVKAKDNDGVDTVGALVDWDHPFVASGGKEPLPQGGVALPLTPTIDAGPLGISFPQFVCGGKETGDMKLRLKFSGSLDGNNSDPATFINVIVHVVGPPSVMKLTADPATVDCNGTNSSKITATVSTADGVPVADGVDVNFSVSVLGTSNPITTNTAKGVASSNITPLSAAGADAAGAKGLPVIVTAGDVQQAILVNCSDAPAPVPGGGSAPPPAGGGASPASGRPGGTISGPDTGSNGQAGAGVLSWWPAIGLVGAAMMLCAASFALRRAD